MVTTTMKHREAVPSAARSPHPWRPLLALQLQRKCTAAARRCNERKVRLKPKVLHTNCLKMVYPQVACDGLVQVLWPENLYCRRQALHQTVSITPVIRKDCSRVASLQHDCNVLASSHLRQASTCCNTQAAAAAIRCI